MLCNIKRCMISNSYPKPGRDWMGFRRLCRVYVPFLAVPMILDGAEPHGRETLSRMKSSSVDIKEYINICS
jgi:hypothetical protein